MLEHRERAGVLLRDNMLVAEKSQLSILTGARFSNPFLCSARTSSRIVDTPGAPNPRAYIRLALCGCHSADIPCQGLRGSR